MVRAVLEGEDAWPLQAGSIPTNQRKKPQRDVTTVLSMRQRALAYKGGDQETLRFLSGGNDAYGFIDYLEEREVRWLRCRFIVPGPPGFLYHARSR